MKLFPFVKEEEIFRLDLLELYAELKIVPENVADDLQQMLLTLHRRIVYPEANEVLASLMCHHRVVIASNSDHEPLMLNIDRNGVPVQGVYSSETLGSYKPDRAFYARFSERSGVAPIDVVYVGDSPEEDILGPKSVGMSAIWVNRRGAKLDPSLPAPDLEIVDLRGLLPHFEKPQVLWLISGGRNRHERKHSTMQHLLRWRDI